MILVNDDYGISAKYKDYIIRYDKINKFFDLFRQTDGFTITTSVLKEPVKEDLFESKEGLRLLLQIIPSNDPRIFTDKDAFMRSMPALVDAGIMGTPCVSRNTCQAACYQGRGHKTGKDMTLEDYKAIIDEIKGHSFQVALGGSGNPDEYPFFEELLKYTRDNDIIPNYTTSGHTLTKEKAELTKKYCGAAAVSWAHPGSYRDKAIQLFLDAGVTTNIHYVLGKDTIDEAISLLGYATKEITETPYDPFPQGINAVIFLLYKPVGCGDNSNVLDVSDPKVKQFYELVDNFKGPFKVGFDSCACSGVVNFCNNINTMSFDACESGRMSVYVTPDMHLLPCSFDNQHYKFAVSLYTYSIGDIWNNSNSFNQFRQSFINSCPTCSKKEICLGSCPLCREIVICDREEKDLK